MQEDYEKAVTRFLEENVHRISSDFKQQNLSGWQDCTPRNCILCGRQSQNWTMLTAGYVEKDGQRWGKHVYVGAHITCREKLITLAGIILSYYPMNQQVTLGLEAHHILEAIGFPQKDGEYIKFYQSC